MSNSLAIAAVTTTLQSMLSKGITADLPPDVPVSLNLGNTEVTTKPPDKARTTNDNKNQVNIFLYRTTPSGAMRNLDMIGQTKPGETGQPPAALDLDYVITAYGQNDDDTAAHILMGQVVRIFHDNAVLSRSEIEGALPGNDLHEQVERVRVTAQPLSLEELSKLWTTFATKYRLSMAFRVSVVLIESRQPARAPLPVLVRGLHDEGVDVRPDLLPPFPTLEAVVLPPHQFGVRLGEMLKMTGYHLDGDSVAVHFNHPRLKDAIARPPESSGTTSKQIMVKIPAIDPAPAQWPPGTYTVAANVAKAGEERTTNELSFALAPRIETISPATAAPGDFQLTLTCTPQVRPEQRVALLFGSREIQPEPFSVPGGTGEPTTLNFQVKDAEAGEHFLRLRVDGVDSILVKYEGDPPKPLFDPDQKVDVS